MSTSESAKIGQSSEPGEYDAGMLALLQIIWGDGFLSPGGADELSRVFAGSAISGCEVLDIGCDRIGPSPARHFIDNWRQLVVVLERGELRPGHLKAVKPLSG